MNARRIGCIFVPAGLGLILLGATGWLTWQSSDISLPPLVHGLPAGFAAGDRVFKARVQHDYPVGSDERRLVEGLTAQGFTIVASSQESSASLRRFMGCGDRVWRVDWRADRKKLTRVFAIYDADCL
jgi:hypothetical protein